MILGSTLVMLALGAGGAPDPLSEQALLDQIGKINEAADHRPTHVQPPLEGTFAEHAAPYFERLKVESGQLEKPAVDDLREFIGGKRSWESLPLPLRETIEAALPDAKGLLLASHATSGRLPQNLTGLMRAADPFPEISVQFAMRVVAGEIRRTLKTQPSTARSLCIDGLAVARDFTYGNILSHMVGSGGFSILLPACLAAVESEPSDASDCVAIRSIATHTAPLSVMVEQERVFLQLGFGESLSRETVAQLPEAARRVLDQPREKTRPVRFAKLRGFLFGTWARRDMVRATNKLLEVADRGPTEADRSFAQFEDQLGLGSELFGIDGGTNWLDFVQRVRAEQTKFNALASMCEVVAARRREGHWRSAANSMSDARTGAPLRFEALDSTHAKLLAQGDEALSAEPIEFSISLENDSP